MRYSHLVFDIDGTLIDTNGPYLLAMQRLLRERFGQEKSLDDLLCILGVPERLTLKRFGFSDVEEAYAAVSRYFDEYSGGIRVFDGLEDTLAGLKALGYPMGLVTSKTRSAFDGEFSRLSIAAYFGTAVCFDDTSLHKPDPAPMLCYLSRTGADPARTLYVGDSPNDLAMCRAAGVGCVLVTWGSFQRERDPSVRYLSHPRELLKLLQL